LRKGATGSVLLRRCYLRRLAASQNAGLSIESKRIQGAVPEVATLALEDEQKLSNQDQWAASQKAIVKLSAKSPNNFKNTDPCYLQVVASFDGQKSALVSSLRDRCARNDACLAENLKAQFPNTLKLKSNGFDTLSKLKVDLPTADAIGFPVLRLGGECSIAAE
jgi:hypothetical protein